MICPKCQSDTRVVSSRPHADDATVIVRRRYCVACPERFETQESTFDVVQRRTADRRSSPARYRRWAETATPEERAARWKLKRMRTSARAEAAETGKPLPEVLKAWGLTPSTPAPPRRSHPLP